MESARMNQFTVKLIEKLKNQIVEELRKCSICDESLLLIYDSEYNLIFLDTHCGCIKNGATIPHVVTPDELDFYTEQEYFRKKWDL